MDIEHQLKAAFREEFGAGLERTTREQYEEFEKRRRARMEVQGNGTEGIASICSARYGIAAYVVGVHLASGHDPSAAEEWLQDAASLDIGDAAYRLARIHEARAVEDFNRQITLADGQVTSFEEKFSEAAYWFHKAEQAGYAMDGHAEAEFLERPVISLECCSAMRSMQAEERAAETLLVARMQAEKLLREAREDASATVDAARHDVQELSRRNQQLSREHQRLTAEVEKYRRVLQIVSQLSAESSRALPRLVPLVISSWFNPSTRSNLEKVRTIYASVSTRVPSRSHRWFQPLRHRLEQVAHPLLSLLGLLIGGLLGVFVRFGTRPGRDAPHGNALSPSGAERQAMWPEADEVTVTALERDRKLHHGGREWPDSPAGDDLRRRRRLCRSTKELVGS